MFLTGIGLCVVLLFGLGMAACSSTMEGVGKDLDRLWDSMAQQEVSYLEDLGRGKRQYHGGDFSAAIVSLTKAVKWMNEDSKPNKRHLVDAHLHLGLCYKAKGQTALAKQEFKTVLRIDSSYQLSPGEYAGDVVRLFEEARREVRGNP